MRKGHTLKKFSENLLLLLSLLAFSTPPVYSVESVSAEAESPTPVSPIKPQNSTRADRPGDD